MNSDETPELRTAAIAIWHFQQMGGKEAWAATVETRAKQQRRVERFYMELQRIVGERDDIRIRVNGGCVEAEVEDLRFVALETPLTGRQEPMTLVTLLGRCSTCGVETVSEPVTGLAGLGGMLENFKPIYFHFCLSTQQS